jgi:hypothetical protein
MLLFTNKNIHLGVNIRMGNIVDKHKISEIFGYRIVNIQNLERKDVLLNKRRTENKTDISTINKVKSLSKNYSIKHENIYYWTDTSTGVEQTFESNNFIGSFLNAYNTHCDIVLNPDNIWIMISLYFSKYVDANVKTLRSKIVKGERDGEGEQLKKIVVKEYVHVEQSFRTGQELDYFYEQIYEQVKSNTMDGVIDALKCDFSTSGSIQKIISTSIIMNSFKKSFSYGRLIMDCGINNIYFQGVRDDWVKLIKKTENLAQYDVDSKLIKYIQCILTILKQFVDTWDGQVDVEFWNRILATKEKLIGSGGQTQTMIEGWILWFFGEYEFMDLDNVPDYSISVPIELENKLTGTKKNLDIVAGWLSVSKMNDYSHYVFKSDLGLAIIENSKGGFTI